MKPIDVRSHLLAALEADLIGPFTLGEPGVTPEEAHGSAEVLPMPRRRWVGNPARTLGPQLALALPTCAHRLFRSARRSRSARSPAARFGRVSALSVYDHHRSVPAFTPTFTANSSAVAPLRRHFSTVCCHQSFERRVFIARDRTRGLGATQYGVRQTVTELVAKFVSTLLDQHKKAS